MGLFNYVSVTDDHSCLLLLINQCDMFSRKVFSIDVASGYRYVSLFIITSTKSNDHRCLLLLINQCDMVSRKVFSIDVASGYRYISLFIITSKKWPLIVLIYQTIEKKFLRRADPLSRGILPIVVCLCDLETSTMG